MWVLLLVFVSVKLEFLCCVSGLMVCYCKGSGWMFLFNLLVCWVGVINVDDMCFLYLMFI